MTYDPWAEEFETLKREKAGQTASERISRGLQPGDSLYGQIAGRNQAVVDKAQRARMAGLWSNYAIQAAHNQAEGAARQRVISQALAGQQQESTYLTPQEDYTMPEGPQAPQSVASAMSEPPEAYPARPGTAQTLPKTRLMYGGRFRR